jgi:uncharacterized membrane protein YhhN
MIFVSAAVAMSLALHLRAEYLGPTWQVYVFKPLTTTLVIVLAVLQPGRSRGMYRPLIVAGLVCSLAGDVFLMLPADRFVAGLGSFLGAHVCYIAAFAASGGAHVTPRLLVPFAAYSFLLVSGLWPHLGPVKLPVAIYAGVLAAMGWLAAERWRSLRTRAAAGAAIGAVSFVASDSALALSRFVVPFGTSTAIVMVTYVAAQYLIARSIDAEVRG